MRLRTALLAAALALAPGCTHTVYTPARHSEAHTERTVERDTLIITDNVRLDLRSNTVRLTTTRTLYRTRTLRDTVRTATTDTIYLPSPATSAERKAASRLTWQGGALALIAGAAAALWLTRGSRRA